MMIGEILQIFAIMLDVTEQMQQNARKWWKKKVFGSEPICAYDVRQ